MPHPLDPLTQHDEYVARFRDAALWAPYVREVCARHDLDAPEPIRAARSGSSPVFSVADRWLVKFFDPTFNDLNSFQSERACARLLTAHPVLPFPTLLGEGALDHPGALWPWPYLIFAYLPGVEIGEVYAQISHDQHMQLAHELGGWIRAFHDLPLPDDPAITPGWDGYLAELRRPYQHSEAHNRAYASLPERFYPQMADFILPPEQLILPGEQPHLVHADLTSEHLLGRMENGRWHTLALIDFADAATGSLLYELCALHLDLFRFDRRLLTVFLDGYGYTGPRGAWLARRAMSTALLHHFDVLYRLRERPDLTGAGSLEELALRLWEV